MKVWENLLTGGKIYTNGLSRPYPCTEGIFVEKELLVAAKATAEEFISSCVANNQTVGFNLAEAV